MIRAPLIVWILLVPWSAFASAPDDPLPIRSQLPFKLLFLEPAPAAAGIEPDREARFALHLTYENTLVASDALVNEFDRNGDAYDGRVTFPTLASIAAGQPSGTAYVLDGETLRTVLDARLGIARRLEVGVEVPFLSQGRGFMDGPIDSFHDHLHLPDGGRTGFARGEFRAGYIGDGQTVYLDDPPGGFRLGDIVVSVAGAIVRPRGRMPAVSAALSAKLPTGAFRNLAGSGSTDYGLALRLSRKWPRSTLHLGSAWNHVGEWKLAPGLPLHASRSLYASYAFAANPRVHLIAQAIRTSGPFPFRSGNDLGKVAMEVSAGIRYHLPGGVDLEWAVIENLEPYYNTPDVGMFLGVRCRTASAGPAGGSPPAVSRPSP
ncbi:MAG TPA: DUF3187 family protein [Candidatus Polarisedimenticolia bacterium]|jgi:hypothetical protein|nr:DUF3187 family protein [Candidatus Polarisedimenticolia bacterium]